MALCASCNAPMHDFVVEEALGCVPPRDVLVFTTHTLDPDYRAALLHEHPQFTVEEIVGSSLGHCPHFPSQDDWLCDVKTALRSSPRYQLIHRMFRIHIHILCEKVVDPGKEVAFESGV